MQRSGQQPGKADMPVIGEMRVPTFDPRSPRSRASSWAYLAARKLMTFDVTVVVWLESRNLRLPGIRDDEYTFRFLSPDDVCRLAVDESNDIPAQMAGRLRAERDYCMAAFSGERLASYAWFALDSIEAENNCGAQPKSGVAVSFPEQVAFLYKGFTHADFRGRKLHGEVIGRSLIALAPLGVEAAEDRDIRPELPHNLH